MTDPTLDTLTPRLDRLERAVRRWKRGSTVAAALAGALLLVMLLVGWVLLGRNAEKYVVVDRQGNVRTILGTQPDLSVGLSLFDKDGKTRALFGVMPDGQPLLALANEEGKLRAVLGTGREGALTLSLGDTSGKVRAEMAVLSDGSPHLFFADQAGKIIWKAP